MIEGICIVGVLIVMLIVLALPVAGDQKVSQALSSCYAKQCMTNMKLAEYLLKQRRGELAKMGKRKFKKHRK